ncbi:MAG: hypothetical protein NVS3B16_10110 [Vulcanimicrobiaceae bacterium]
MHLRLPLVAGVVVVAAAAALVRAHSAATPQPQLALSRASAAPPLAILPRPARTPAPTIVVYVAGDVVRPGIYALPRLSRAADAVAAAGGARPDADLVAVNLAAPVRDGEEVAVVAKGDAAAPPHPRGRGHAANAAPGAPAPRVRHRRTKHARKGPAAAAAADAVNDGPTAFVDLNRADASELESLPGIGAALAGRIVAVREASGPFASADDLLDVGGMTQGRLDAIVPYILVR